MTTDKKRGFFSQLSEGFDEVKNELVSVVDEFKIDQKTPVPAVDAVLIEKLNYVETVKLYIGLDRPNGTTPTANGYGMVDYGDETRFMGITPALLKLCRANLDTNPELIDAVIEPLLAHRRSLGYGKTLREQMREL